MVAGNQELASTSATNTANTELLGQLQLQFAVQNVDICSDDFGIAEADAACKYLGFAKATRYDEVVHNELSLQLYYYYHILLLSIYLISRFAFEHQKSAIIFSLTCNGTKDVNKLIQCQLSEGNSSSCRVSNHQYFYLFCYPCL